MPSQSLYDQPAVPMRILFEWIWVARTGTEDSIEEPQTVGRGKVSTRATKGPIERVSFVTVLNWTHYSIGNLLV